MTTTTTTATDENQGAHGKGGGLVGREFGPTGRKDNQEKPSPQEQAFELAEASLTKLHDWLLMLSFRVGDWAD
jgi:hypothetical protein